ncbi:MAG: GNAT family N-acetyltransferase [Clostridiales bacterium]|jgi:ribosomal protein S18 acetylase RimI-like enzyme|nr:GNAT family N-acetyltransferase [Clostridiales bacterium]
MIRPAEERDIPKVMELLKQVAQAHHLIRPDLFRSGAAKYTPDELSGIFACENTPVFVYDDAGEVKGYCFCIIKRHAGEGALNDYTELYIDDLCVDENCRGQGVGTQLYRHAVSFARREGFGYITLNVWEGNKTALDFYKTMGLKPLKYVMEQPLKEDT